MVTARPKNARMANIDLRDLTALINEQIMPCRGVLYFARDAQTPVESNAVNNGGFALVQTSKRKLLVTCNHVWEGFKAAHREDPALRLFLGLNLQDHKAVAFKNIEEFTPIAQDANLDLAVFDVSPLLRACRERKFYRLDHNPPPELHSGDKLVVLGNQARNRRPTEAEIELGLSTYLIEVSDAGKDSLRFQASLLRARFYEITPPVRQPLGSPHGGISGSPCFLYVRRSHPLKLVGFATEDGFGSLFFTHVKCLTRDGTINRDGPW